MKKLQPIIVFFRSHKFLSLFLIITISLFFFVRASLEKTEFLNVERIEVDSLDDIIPVDDSLVAPVLYPNVESLDSLEGDQLINKFIDVLLPAILIAKHRIDSVRDVVMPLRTKENWTPADSSFYKELAEKYNANGVDNLLLKMQTHPNSIVLAQAAMESGWGTSRFFREGNNLFGVWSFDPDEPRMRAAYKRGSKPIYVRKYEDVSQSIEDYFMVLARGGAYDGFRKSRVTDEDPFEMVNHLVRYSEKRWKYVRLLKLLMRKNDLTRYDSYRIDPEYFVSETQIRWLNL